MSELKSISPARAAELIRAGAVLVDVRELDEHKRERIPGAHHHPLSGLDKAKPGGAGDVLIFHCKSGARTRANAPRLTAAADCEAYVLDGGIESWRKAGLPVEVDRKHPIALARQVQILAGTLVILGLLLAYLVAPAFYGLVAFVGAGLIFAGFSGSCLSARLLARMPWNSDDAAANAAQGR
jgi:rhodanese-related sulfurtransferase